MDAFRLFLHVLAASIWVGRQFTLAGLLPTVRGFGEDAPRLAGRAFNRLAWPAYGVLVLTGLWNLFDLPLDYLEHPWIELKVLAVLLSGLGAAAHQMARGNKAIVAIGGAASALFGVAAMYMGFLVTPVP